MNNREGVSKYRLEFVRKASVDPGLVDELNRWRHIHYRLQLIGCSKDRYDGYGFGNISRRFLSGPSGSFIISGTQTGGKPLLSAEDFSLVTSCNPQSNAIVAEGMAEPSSEALTHGQIYQLERSIQCVIHAHSPDIWQASRKLNLPRTGEGAAYGTPQMAEAVEKLFRDSDVLKKRIFVMQGHRDGVVSFGSSIIEASRVMISSLASSLAL